MAYLVKCGCGVGRVETAKGERNEWLEAAIYRSAVVGYRSVVNYRGEPESFTITQPFFCWTCRKAYKVTPIRGRVTAHECGAKCLASKGPTCECACGGKNHGRSYA